MQIISDKDRNKEQLLKLSLSSSLHMQFWPILNYVIPWLWIPFLLVNWKLGLFIKQKWVQQHFSVSFYYKGFSYTEDKYFLLEKQIWTIYMAWRILYSVIINHIMVKKVHIYDDILDPLKGKVPFKKFSHRRKGITVELVPIWIPSWLEYGVTRVCVFLNWRNSSVASNLHP